MSKIWKYSLPLGHEVVVDLPRDAKILTVQTQRDVPCIWVVVEPDAELESRAFRIFGTGHSIPDNYQGLYIGSFQLDGGSFVFHLFEDWARHPRNRQLA